MFDMSMFDDAHNDDRFSTPSHVCLSLLTM